MMRHSPPFVPQFDDVIEFKRPVPHEWVESTAPGETSGRVPIFLGTTIQQKKISFLLYCIGGVLLAILIRSSIVQVFSGSHFALLAARNTIKSITVSAQRGILYDRNGTVLVRNVPQFIIVVYPQELPRNHVQYDDEIKKLSGIISIPVRDIEQDILKSNFGDQVTIGNPLEYPDALTVINQVTQMQGVQVLLRDRREYVNNGDLSLSHLLGYMGPITEQEYSQSDGTYQSTSGVGRAGLEKQYEKFLKGNDGVKKIEIDALGVEKRVLSQEDPVYGKSIVLTIDSQLQQISEQALRDTLKKFNVTKGVVIVSQPATGDILAWVSIPTYDDNIFSKGISQNQYNTLISDPDQPLLDRVISGEYPSGSTIKPAVAAGGLQEGVITPSTTVLSTGGLHVGQWFFPDWKAGGHGMTNLAKALAESVNTFFYIVGGGYKTVQGLGPDRLLSYFHLFGFGEKTGIDLPGEKSGFLPSKEWKKKTTGQSWYIGDTYHISIGQGALLVTPLQIHQLTSYFANGGWTVVPHFLKGTKTDTGVDEVPPVLLKQNLIDQKNTDAIREGLRQGVVSGSSKRLSLLPVTAAGKTGTAQWGVNKPPHAWFTGWAPYEKPEIVVTVLIEQGVEGSSSAVLVGSDIMQWYFRGRKPNSSSQK